MTKDVHVKQEEWAYPAKKAVSRKRAKRAVNKAKRRIVKKMVSKDSFENLEN